MKHLHDLVQGRIPDLTNEKLELLKVEIDKILENIPYYTGSTNLQDFRYAFWKSLSFKQDIGVGSIAASLMSAPASEGCCE
jgi:hypothetical protein